MKHFLPLLLFFLAVAPIQALAVEPTDPPPSSVPDPETPPVDPTPVDPTPVDPEVPVDPDPPVDPEVPVEPEPEPESEPPTPPAPPAPVTPINLGNGSETPTPYIQQHWTGVCERRSDGRIYTHTAFLRDRETAHRQCLEKILREESGG